MRHNSNAYWIDKHFWSAGAVACGLMLALSTGCESLQRKFTRQKTYKPASPIVGVQDYSQALTPLDRYRKHYVMFDYWNTELIDAFQTQAGSTMPGAMANHINPKRVKLAAWESLQELQKLQSLLGEESAQRLQPLIDERAALTTQLMKNMFMSSTSSMVNTIERQTRDLKHSWYWRRVEDQLKPPASSASAATPAPTPALDADGH